MYGMHNWIHSIIWVIKLKVERGRNFSSMISVMDQFMRSPKVSY